MDKQVFAVYGASGYGREVMPVLREHCSSKGVTNNDLIFIDDGESAATVNDHSVMNYESFISMDAAGRHVCVAIADSKVREMLMDRCIADNIQLMSLIASNAVVMDGVIIGAGSILSPFVTITSNVKIGRGFHANIYSYVAHDCRIGDYVTFAPAVKCNGNVVIEDHAYIGTGAILRQGEPGNPLVIGRGAIVGMGAVVTKSVPQGATVVGNPAKPFEKR